MGLVEFIGKNFDLLPTARTVAEKRFEIPELLESRAMTWRAHGILPSLQTAERIALSAQRRRSQIVE
jgi:hypothetical protein